MSKEKLIPELRFPEFHKDGEWYNRQLNEVCDVNPSNGKLPNKFVYIDLESVDSGRLKKRIVVNLKDAPSRAQRLLVKGDIIFQMVRPYQKNNYFFNLDDRQNYVASTGYALLRGFQSKMYLYQFVHSDNFVNRVLSKCTGSNYPAINSSDLSHIRVEIPQLQEQQKIASCLSSLDELIAAHNNKLEALKDHKKGLLQNLFPSATEGERSRTPNYRFPEFEKDGEWEKISIGSFIVERNDISNGDNPLYSLTIEEGVTPKSERYERSFLVKNQKEAYKVVLPEDFVYNPMNLRFGAIAQHKGNNTVALSKYYNVFYCDDTVDSRFCEYYFRSNQMLRTYDDISTGSLIEKRRVHFSEFLKLEIPLPQKTEQQKIASCLSALDELITAQAQKIEQLRDHKKGLMQGLFPSAKD